MPTISSAKLTHLSREIFAAAGCPRDIAETVAVALVSANLSGHDSHGVIRIPSYLEKIDIGEVVPDARPTLARSPGAVRIVDGNHAFGQVVAPFGADQAVDAARAFGIGCAVLTRVNHIGRAGDYAERIALEGLVGLVFTSGSMIGPQVTIHGGRDRLFTTNPYAWAVPRGDGRPPLLIDCATAAISGGKVMVAIENEAQVPAGCLLDANGQPTRNPNDLRAGGALLPFGDYKGSGLMMMIELTATLFGGYAPVSSENFRPGNPTVLTAWSIDAFCTPDRFEEEVEALCARIKKSGVADGFDEILLPGEPENRSRREKGEHGIDLPDPVWRSVQKAAEGLGVDLTGLK
jgi:uncharacterized oxidoreductase